MIAACGYEVARLKRVRFGTLALGDLAPGQWRYLTRDEVRSLRRLVQEAYEARLGEERPGKRSGRGR
jgi:16S rRNA U516 pseudouridylate synthase RsuA-like enzyme